MTEFFQLFMEKKGELLQLFLEHMNMTALAVFISLAIGVPIGVLITRNKTISKIVIGIANIMQSIPSIALLAFSVPFLGIGTKPAIFMVIIYALLPIIKNTYTGIISIDPKTIEVAKGLGLTKWKRLFRIELPIAAPFIMSGIRISAVAAVGTMTIAAFAGAGGLGWFINLGLNSQNIGLVLLGAIPASLLALGIDFLLGRLEHAVTPEGLMPADQIQNVPKKKRRLERIIIFCLCGLLVLIPAITTLSETIASQNEKKITVASSNFTETIILGYMYSELIEENTDIEVEQRFNLNGGIVCFNAIKSGDADMYVEYTGSILPNYLHQKIETTDPQEVYDQASKAMKDNYNLQLSQPLGFNNTYVMAMKPDVAEKYNIHTLSELMKVSDQLRLGCTVNFAQREDCLPLMEKTFGTSFQSVNGLEGAIRYNALASNEVDVIDAFSTDALIEKQGLTLIEDDIHFFPPYYAANVVRQETLDKFPELEPVLAKMEGLFDEQTMRSLNSKVDIDGIDAKDVAHEFLVEKGLISA